MLRTADLASAPNSMGENIVSNPHAGLGVSTTTSVLQGLKLYTLEDATTEEVEMGFNQLAHRHTPTPTQNAINHPLARVHSNDNVATLNSHPAIPDQFTAVSPDKKMETSPTHNAANLPLPRVHSKDNMVIIDVRPNGQPSATDQLIAVTPDNITKILSLFMITFCAVPAALVEASDVGASLDGVQKSIYIVGPAMLIAFFAASGLTFKPVKVAIEECVDIWSHWCLPTKRNRNLSVQNPRWPDLPADSWAEHKALAIGASLGLWGAFSKGCLAYYIMETLFSLINVQDSWYSQVVKSGFAIAYAITGALTENMETYAVVRQSYAENPDPNQNNTALYLKVIAFMAFVIAAPFVFVNATGDVLNAVEGITQTCGLNDHNASNGRVTRWPILATLCLSTIGDAVPKIMFEGRQVIEGVNGFFKYLYEVTSGESKITLMDFITFLLTMALPIALEIWKQPINKSFFMDIANDIFNPSPTTDLVMLVTLFSYLTVIGGILIGAKSLHEEVKTLVESSVETSACLYKSAVRRFKSESEDRQPLAQEMRSINRAGSLAANPAALFSLRDKTPTPPRDRPNITFAPV